MENKTFFSQNLRFFRKKAGMTQKEFASKIGFSDKAVNKWEKTGTIPGINTILDICTCLKISLNELLLFNTNDDFYLAIDGGGTKTEFVLFNETGEFFKRITLGASNPNVVGMEKVFDVIDEGIERLYIDKDNVRGVFAGIAGCGFEKNSVRVENHLKEILKNAMICVESDIMNVIGSVPHIKNCAAIICGTGSVAYAYENSVLTRVGGWGYLLELSGSGYDIGRDALIAAISQRDRIGEDTILTEAVEEKLGSSVWDSIDKIYSSKTEFIASFAPLVFEACEKGDRVSKGILQKNAKHMSDLVEKVMKNHDCSDTLLMSGGLLSKDSVYAKMIEANLGENKHVIIPEIPQVFGACIRCLKQCGKDTQMIEKVFESEFKNRRDNNE